MMVDTAQISIEMCSVTLLQQPSQEFALKGLTRQSQKSKSTRKRVGVKDFSRRQHLISSQEGRKYLNIPLQDTSLSRLSSLQRAGLTRRIAARIAAKQRKSKISA